MRRPAILTDGQYRHWERALALRYPLTLSEMRWPSPPLGSHEACPLARWGIECRSGWRTILERLFDALEGFIAAAPAERRHELRIRQIKEKFGGLTVHLAGPGTPAMLIAIEEAGQACLQTCEVCSASGILAERRGWWAVRCGAHESWSWMEQLI